jgi:hypothetical protein
MIVMEGESFELTDGKWLKLELSVNDTDLERQLVDWDIPDALAAVPLLPGSLVYDILSVLAQRLLTARAYASGGYTNEEARMRLGELNARANKQYEKVQSLIHLSEQKSG